MNIEKIFGGNPLGVIFRLAVICLIVGIVLSALGIRPDNLFYQLNLLAQRIYDLGFGAFEWILGYLVLGAMVVIPIWLIVRAFGLARKGDDR